ncbi:MAG: flavodoxin, partial [Leuconostoc gelidum]
IKGADGIKINLRPDDEDTVTLNAFVTKLIQKAQN